jgi:replicative DNA helicase
MTGCSGPTGFGNIDNHTVGAAIFNFHVDMTRQPFSKTQGIIDIIANCRSRGSELPIGIGQLVDLKANMM